MRSQWNQNRRSFTLVELLVVIVIIGILSALITQTVMSAMTAAREASVKFELQSIAQALENYKAEYGEYPPDYSDPAVVERHIRLRWPRITQTELTTIRGLNLTRPQALVFWLRGFSGSPTNPHTAGGNRVPMVNFDKARLVPDPTNPPTAIVPVYVAQYGNKGADGATTRPYIYFDGKTYGHTNAVYQNKRPYLSDLVVETYAANDSFQLLHPGLNGEWGATAANASYPSGLNYLPDDRDNITNFCKGRTLDDDIP